MQGRLVRGTYTKSTVRGAQFLEILGFGAEDQLVTVYTTRLPLKAMMTSENAG